MGLLIAGFIVAYVPVLFSLIQLILTFVNIGYVNKRQLIIGSRINTLKKFYRLIAVIEDECFSSSSLKSIKAITFHKDIKPSASFSKLIRWVDALDNRMNVLMAVVLNSLFLWDINFMYRIEEWADEFSAVFPRWIDAIAQFDSLSSLACFMYNNPGYVIPEVSDSEDFFLGVTDGGHPLLKESDLVTNDIVQQGSPDVFLITGANMAGKSTFLRMVGLGLVLAMSGTAVCASKFVFTPVQLYTSMRTNDSLQRQTSFFFAELKRLKFIVEQLRSGEKSYILLDEILKGTNSKDQHTGSTKLIKNLIKLNGIGMIATHDVELTMLSAVYPDYIKNIAFEIEMKNGEMIFDYKYKEGVCKNMNATLLMEQMNIF